MAEAVVLTGAVIQGVILLNQLCVETTTKSLGDLTKSLLKNVFRGPRKVVSKTKQIMKAASRRIDNIAAVALLDLYRSGEMTRNPMKMLPQQLSPADRSEVGFRRESQPFLREEEKINPTAYQPRQLVKTESQREAQFQEIESKLMSQMKNAKSKVAEVTQRVRILTQRPTQARIEKVLEELDYMEGHLHIAVAGNSGTGKSSFINAIRGLRDSDPSAARVNFIESTRKITRYAPTSTLCKVVWYDVPGAGTLNIPAEGYFVEQGLYIMNAIIILWTNRLTETDVNLIEYCALLKIPCLLVRSKCDEHLRNIRNALKDEFQDSQESHDSHVPINIIAEKFAEQLVRFREESVALGRLKIQEAYKAARADWTPDWDSLVFLINKYSMCTMVTDELLDKNALDEERFLLHLSSAMAFLGSTLDAPSSSDPRSREEIMFDYAIQTSSQLQS